MRRLPIFDHRGHADRTARTKLTSHRTPETVPTSQPPSTPQSDAPGEPFLQRILTLEDLFTLTSRARGAAIPQRLGDRLRRRRPAVRDDDRRELDAALERFASAALVELDDLGIRPSGPGEDYEDRLTTQERVQCLNLAALLTWRAHVNCRIGNCVEAVALADAAVAWSTVGGDALQEALAWESRFHTCTRLGDLPSAMSAADRMYESADAAGSESCAARALLYRAEVHMVGGEFDAAEPAIDAGRTFVATHLTGSDARSADARFLCTTGWLALYRGEYSASRQALHLALDEADEALDPDLVATTLFWLGEGYMATKQYQKAIGCYQDTVRIVAAIGVPSEFVSAYTSLSVVYQDMREFEESGRMLDRAEELIDDRSSEWYLGLLVRRGMLFIAEGRVEDATAVNDSAREIAERTSASLRVLPAIVAQQGAICTMRGDHAEALAAYTRAFELGGHTTFRRLHYRYRMSLASYHLGDYDRAAALLQEVESGLDDYPLEHQRVLRLRAAIAEATGDLRLALDLERRAVEIDRRHHLSLARTLYRNARASAEAGLLEQEVEHERSARRRLQKQLADAVIDLSDYRSLIDSLEQHFETEPTLRARSSGRADSGDSGRSTEEVVREFHAIVARLRDRNRDPSTPTRYLAEVGEEFFIRLRHRFPDLPARQERLCGLIRARLTAKEIQAALELTPEGLKTLRKRLRKSLELKPGDRLETAVMEI